MPRLHRILTCLIALAGCCAMSVRVDAQAPGASGTTSVRQGIVRQGVARQGVVRDWNSSEKPTGPFIYTVMGHVRTQRAIELATASPSLVQVIETFAQGLAETASSNIRIVRGGRVINSFYRKDSTERLMPGDLVIVDGRSIGGTVFRGGESNAASPDGVIRIGLLGLRPYPVIMNLALPDGQALSQPLTARYIAGQLGQSDLAAQRARLIIPRRFTQADATTPLPDCSVIVFDSATIDALRLPPTLPTPYQPSQSPPQSGQQDAAAASRQPVGGLGVPRPLAQNPLPNGATRPGIATVPSRPAGSSGVGIAAPSTNSLQPPRSLPVPPAPNTQPLPRDAEERTRDRLTSPSSVPVESAGPPSAIAQNPAAGRPELPAREAPGRVSLGDATAAETRNQASAEGGAAAVPSPAFNARTTRSPAAKPFESFVDQSVPSETEDDQDVPVELPLTVSDSGAEEPGRMADNSESTGSASNETPSDAATGVEAALPQAEQARPRPTDVREPQANTGTGTATQRVDTHMPFPTPVAAGTSGTPTAGIPAAANAASATKDGERSEIVRRTAAVTATPDGVVDAARKGRVVPKVQEPANWPLRSALTIAGLAVASILLMMIVIAWRKPEPPVPVQPGERYWLDRIIQNELPMEEEEVTLPHATQLFGNAAPIHRVDAAHASVPKPHFLASGGESGVRRSTPSSPAAPESGSPDSAPADPGQQTPDTRTPRRDNRPDRSQPAVPMRPAAEHRPTTEHRPATARRAATAIRPGAEPVAESTAERRPMPGTVPGTADHSVISIRSGSLTTGHVAVTTQPQAKTTQPQAQQPAGKPSVASQPAAQQASTGFTLDIARLPVAGSQYREQRPLAADAAEPAASTGTDRSVRRTFRIDGGHAGQERQRPASQPVAQQTGPRPAARRPVAQTPLSGSDEVAPVAPGNVSGDASGTTGQSELVSSESVVRAAVPRPRHLQRQKSTAAGVQSAAVSPSGTVRPAVVGRQANGAAAQAAEPVTSTAASHEEIAVPPARVIAESADLLDRVLSSVQRNKRGDR